MNHKELVSIIVPIFNVEKYVRKCIKSIMKQNYTNIEIILVNDGSSDKSTEIINELSNEDERIIVVHKNNEGVSSARNAGLQIAKGQYIMFIDGDDYVDDDYVDYFVNLLKTTKCDIGFNTNNYAIEGNYSCDGQYIIPAEKAIEWIYSDKIFVAVWNKIYKASVLKKGKIKFNSDIWYGEGMLFNIECLQVVNMVAIGEKAVYHQTFNPQSAMRNFNLESNYCGIKSLELQKKVWKKRTKRIEQAWEYHYYRFNRTIIDGLVRSGGVEKNRDVYNKCVKNIRKNIVIVFKEEKELKKLISWALYYIVPMYMAKRSAKKFKETLYLAENQDDVIL